MSPQGADVVVVCSLAKVFEAFMQIAATLRSLPGVRVVGHPCWMRTEDRIAEDQYRVGGGEGCRVEWYAEGEFTDGRTLSFGLELSWHDGEWVIDASIRACDDQGERMLLELPRRYATDADDLVRELSGETMLLLERQEEGIHLFMER